MYSALLRGRRRPAVARWQRRGRLAAGAISCLMAAGAFLVAPAAAPAMASTLTFAVNTTADAHDAHPGDGQCADSAGRCTLRAAVEEADASPAGSTVTITVPAGIYHLALGTLAVGATPALNITVDGAGQARTVIDAGGAFRVMTVAATATAVVENLQITGGNAGRNSYGGGIFSQGTLTLARDLIARNEAGAGGGVDNSGGSLVVAQSRVMKNNGGFFGGGGIQNGGPMNLPGSVLVVNSTIFGNVTNNEGGGIFSGQNGVPAGRGRAAVAPLALCSGIRCRAQRLLAASGLTLTVLDSHVVGNVGGNGGGGIAAAGPALVIGSVIDGNSAGGAIGGGLFNVPTVRDSTISGNSASSGGGVENFPAVPVTITNATIDGNRAQSYGGGIYVNGTVTVTRSTIAGNNSGGHFLGFGPAVTLAGGSTLTLTNSTVTGNVTKPPGQAAIYNFDGLAVLSFDTIAGNTGAISGGYFRATGTLMATSGSTPDCAVPVHETAGFNLATDASCGLALGTDVVTANPLLGPLARNGGDTMTMALLPGSPAIDAGGLPSTSGCPLTDQRGASRPWGPACDIGAFELHYRP